MERKQVLKQKVQDCREDIQFYLQCQADYKKLLEDHCGKHHNKRLDPNCERCDALSQLVTITNNKVFKLKSEIRGILRGE